MPTILYRMGPFRALVTLDDGTDPYGPAETASRQAETMAGIERYIASALLDRVTLFRLEAAYIAFMATPPDLVEWDVRSATIDGDELRDDLLAAGVDADRIGVDAIADYRCAPSVFRSWLAEQMREENAP